MWTKALWPVAAINRGCTRSNLLQETQLGLFSTPHSILIEVDCGYSYAAGDCVVNMANFFMYLVYFVIPEILRKTSV
jgi:hypothetical protein